MSESFDMDIFLSGMLTGSYATRQRHLHQAKVIQTSISGRWKLHIPWTWQRKHLGWFLNHRLSNRAEATRYYYFLTAKLIAQRLGKEWFRS